MAQMNVISIEDPRAEKGDKPVVLVNLVTGRLREVACGPNDAAHFSGDRLVYWNKLQSKAEIPQRHQKKWRFYREFCADPAVAKAEGLTVPQSAKYFDAYLDLIKIRGVGIEARHIQAPPEQIAAIWHPALRRIREAHKLARGQARAETGLDTVIGGLPGKVSP